MRKFPIVTQVNGPNEAVAAKWYCSLSLYFYVERFLIVPEVWFEQASQLNNVWLLSRLLKIAPEVELAILP